MSDLCPCGSTVVYTECCEPVIKGRRKARTPEQLMRSRYSAYAKGNVKYIFDSSLPELRETLDQKATQDWADKSSWDKLEIVATEGGGTKDTEGKVEFKAHFTVEDTPRVHHEKAVFKKVENKWYYSDGEMMVPKPFVREEPRIGRNDPCICGSGKKYKKCCGVNKKEE